jgi:hypothetical protein
MNRITASRFALAACACVALGALVATITGCTTATPTAAQTSGTKPAMSAVASTNASAVASTNASAGVQTCGECDGSGAPKATAGAATLENGIQTVSVAIVGGYYVPNRITGTAGVPVRVVFTGAAKGCVAKPTFKSLGKSGDMNGTGTVTLDLGTLAAGTYEWTCAMGHNKGTITLQ